MRYISNQGPFDAFRIIDVRQNQIGTDWPSKAYDLQLESGDWVTVSEEASARYIPPVIGDYFIYGNHNRVIAKDQFEIDYREDENQVTE